ncbi:cytochrome P450 [Streptomyces sp. NPDC008163]|uniref:cytochrome P450 n=1 Tax=Streptomyces sp. NPDC008163 TaxID=3364818 RepID=UPI0036E7AAE4
MSKVTVAVNGRPAWLFTRYDLIRQILSDPRLSANIKLPGYPIPINVDDSYVQSVRRGLFNLDGQEHAVQRRLLGPEFSVKTLEKLRPRIQSVVDDYINRMLEQGGPVDLVRALSIPMPSQVVCEILGIPFQDREVFQNWSGTLMNSSTGPEEQIRILGQMEEYLGKQIAEKAANPGDDLPSRVIAKNEREGHGLSLEDIAWMTNVLNGAAHETTANNLTLGVLALLQHPEQLAEFKSDPSLAPKVVEEVLRYSSTNDWGTSRVATEDIEIGGVLIRAGEGIITSRVAGNYDDGVFENPEVFDIHRGTSNHLAFGYGVHGCVAQNLARLELQIALTTLFTRIPDLRLATPAEELRVREHALIHGIHELPVTW